MARGEVASMCTDGLVRGRGRPRISNDPMQQAHHLRCLMYRVYDKLSVPQVAERMGISERTVVYWTKLALTYHGYPEIEAVRKLLEKRRKVK